MRRNKFVGLIASVLALASGCIENKPSVQAQKPAPKVEAVRPSEGVYTRYEIFVGQIEARYRVDIRARVTGYLQTNLYREGEEVGAGSVLYEIDPRTYQAEYDRAEAAVAQAEAHLKRCEADERRATLLYGKQAMSREDYDKFTGDYLEAAAAVGTARAIRDNSKLNLSWTSVVSPIDGIISYRMVDPGNLVKADDTILTSVVSSDPLLVYFNVNEQTMLEVRKLVEEGEVRSYREHALMVDVGLANDREQGRDVFPLKARLDFLDNHLDATREIRARAIIRNPRIEPTEDRLLRSYCRDLGALLLSSSISGKGDRLYRPGLYAKVRVPIGAPRKALLVPQKALVTTQGKKSVFVAFNPKEENGKRLYEVKSLELPEEHLGEAVQVARVRRAGGAKTANEGEALMPVMSDHIKSNDLIITNGLQLIRPGGKVELKNDPLGPPAKAEAKTLARTEARR